MNGGRAEENKGSNWLPLFSLDAMISGAWH